MRGYFDRKRDIAIVDAGGFFCHACLIGKPAKDQSPDPRYCKDCHNFLLEEQEKGTIRKPREKPRNDREGWDKVEEIFKPPLVSQNAEGRLGRKNLPEDIIIKLHDEGLSSRAISRRLGDQGVKVSYKTIQRLLSGNRRV